MQDDSWMTAGNDAAFTLDYRVRAQRREEHAVHSTDRTDSFYKAKKVSNTVCER